MEMEREYFDFRLFAKMNNLKLSQSAIICLELMTIPKQKEMLHLLVKLQKDKTFLI
jgi:hypothetical protein